jgi:hypothetical protein
LRITNEYVNRERGDEVSDLDLEQLILALTLYGGVIPFRDETIQCLRELQTRRASVQPSDAHWPTRAEVEKRAAELMAMGRATTALDERERDWMAAREEVLDRARKALLQHDSYCASYDGQGCTCGGASGDRDATLQQGGDDERYQI